MDLHVLRYPEHDLTIFRKYLSPKFCGHYISKTNARKLMKIYIQLHLAKFGAGSILVHISQKVPLLFEIYDFLNIVV